MALDACCNKSCGALNTLKVHIHLAVFQQFDKRVGFALVNSAPRYKRYRGCLTFLILKIHIHLVVLRQLR
jgi:hypothetical protein